jgi:hypothetical protein
VGLAHVGSIPTSGILFVFDVDWSGAHGQNGAHKRRVFYREMV